MTQQTRACCWTRLGFASNAQKTLALTLVGLCSQSFVLVAQQPGTNPPAPPAAPAPAAASSPFFSGVLFANYQYRGDAGPSKAANKFDVERVHLTFRMPAGDRLSVRITADVFQQAAPGNDAFYRGWVIRAKFAYLQYDFLKNANWAALARAGLIQNVFIEHEEFFWPRWISTTAVERAGYFLPGDGGIGTVLTFPRKLGELYATITNGPGFASRETDRFKDYAARVSVTPLARTMTAYLRTLALTGWVYRGAVGSKFAAGGAGQVGTIGTSMPRNRWGLFAGINDPRLVLGADYAGHTDASELGANTVQSPRIETDSTGYLFSFYTVARPFQIAHQHSAFPLGVVARWDYVKPNDQTRPHYYIAIAGLTWPLSKSAAVSLDYQEQTPVDGSLVPASKTYFAHLVANF
jgi:hypothetical protein